ncbi:glycosyltransferase family protein [Desulfarculus baarsii]
MDHLARNLEALAQRQPELSRRLAGLAPHPAARITPSRDGWPTLRLDGQWWCSSVAPWDEGRRLAAEAPDGPLAVLGFGLGYHVEPLADGDVLVWEPDARLLRSALAARDMSAWLAKVRLCLEPPSADQAAGRAVLLHRPTARLHPEAAAVLQRLATAPRPARRPTRPRVLLAPPIMGGSLPVALWCAQALERLGCQVRVLPFHQAAPVYEVMRRSAQPIERIGKAQAPMLAFFSELALLAADDFQPHLFLALAQAPLLPRAVEAMGARGVATAYWFVENHRLFDYFSLIAASYEHFFHIQGEPFDHALSRLGANGHHLPLAAHPPCHRPVSLSDDDHRDFGAPIGFMGSGIYGNRRRALAKVAQSDLGLRLWGSEWPTEGPWARIVALGGRRLADDEVVKVYNACQALINLHSDVDPATPLGRSDFINPRTFEIPACGGLQLVDMAAGLDQAFDLGRELVVVESVADLIEKARHFLAHPAERAAIAAAGRQRVLAEHTYFHRMSQLLDICLGAGQEGVAEDERSARA